MVLSPHKGAGCQGLVSGRSAQGLPDSFSAHHVVIGAWNPSRRLRPLLPRIQGRNVRATFEAVSH